MALAGLLLLAPAAPAGESSALGAERPQAPGKPAVLVRLKALEELIGDLRFLVKEVGREEQAKQVEALLKARTGPKGLEGIDVKKPIGLYATIKSSLNQSEVVLLLPIADEKTFLDFLDTLNFKPENDKDGLYTLKVENLPVPLLFRFANGYLYGTAKLSEKMTLPAADQLPSPEKVLAGGDGLASLTVNVDQLPAQVRKLGVSASSLQLGEMKERPLPGGTEKQKAARDAALDETAQFVKELLEDATAARVKVDLDRGGKELSLSFTLDGKPGSALVKRLAGLRPEKSVAAGLVSKDTVMGGILHLALSEEVRKAAAPAIDDAIDKALGKVGAQEKALLAPVVEALKPTAKAGKLDLGLNMSGPGKKGKYTLVAGAQIEKGQDIEKALKDLLDKLPADAKEPITVDVAKEASVSIHSVKQKHVDEQAKQLFGEGPLYFAVRDDALFFSMGEDALDAIKEAARSRPDAGQPLRVTLSASRLAPLMAKEQKAAPEAAKQAFKEPGSDQVKLAVTAGERLEVKVSVKTAVLMFASLLERAKE
jgi:hypothetical protein